MILKNTDIASLLMQINEGGKKLLCIGAGQQLHDIFDWYDEFGFSKAVRAIFDNYVNMFSWQGKRYDVYPLKQIADHIKDSIIYISSSRYFPELFEQLDAMDALKGVDCYIHNYVRQMPIPSDVILHQGSPVIPKKIHFR